MDEVCKDGEFVVAGPEAERERSKAAGPAGWQSNNLRTTMLKIVERAGLEPWPKLYHNLRASCETDLMRDHGIHVVTSWMGNTPKIALGHYLQTLPRDFEKATGIGLEPGAESGADRIRHKATRADAQALPCWKRRGIVGC